MFAGCFGSRIKAVPSRAALFAICAVGLIEGQQPHATQLDVGGDRTNAASMQTFQIPSHGALLNAFFMSPPGPAHIRR